jgi:4-hydroxy-tetrahydrodipicolinate synthase
MKHPGVIVPMVTAFTSAGGIDDDAIGRIVDHLIGQTIRGIFPLGTTGEAASIGARDKRRVMEIVTRRCAGRATIYAGISGNCLGESIEAAKAYQQLGAAAVVAHVPSYYALSDRQIEDYFLRLADSVPLPLVLYNIPATTHHSISVESVDRLRGHEKIVAIKDSSGDRARLTQLLAHTGGREGFTVLLGSSGSFTHGLRHGGSGLVPSGAHLVGAKYVAMVDAAIAGNWEAVERLQQETDAVCSQYLKGRSLGDSLAALKGLLAEQGLCGPTMLPPLGP